jgi:hypothetical protein
MHSETLDIAQVPREREIESMPGGDVTWIPQLQGNQCATGAEVIWEEVYSLDSCATTDIIQRWQEGQASGRCMVPKTPLNMKA